MTLIDLESDDETPFKLTFRENQIPSVSTTTVWLWNSGKEEIRGDYISKSNPFTIAYPENVEILEHKILKMSRDGNNVHLVQSAPNAVNVNLEFLNPGDGAVLHLLHSGGHGIQAEVKGDLIGPGAEILDDNETRYFVGGMEGGGRMMLLPQKTATAASFILFGILIVLLLVGFFAKSWTLVLVTAAVMTTFLLLNFLPTGTQIPRQLREEEAEGEG